MADAPRFHLIQGTPAPDTPAEQVRKRIRAMPKPATMVQCHRCGGREVIETKIGVLMKNGRPTGGTKTMICVGCLLRGGTSVSLGLAPETLWQSKRFRRPYKYFTMKVAMKLRKPSDVHELDVTKHAVKLLRELADNIESGAAELKSAHRCWNDDDLPLQSMIVVFEKDPTSKL